MVEPLLDKDFKKVLEKHYNLIDIIGTKSFDCGKIESLISRLSATKKEHYASNDRYVIVQFDTDFYWHGHGINLNNLFTVWCSLNLPLYTMLFYTNHFGIGQEIDQLLSRSHPNDRPTVIETFINPGNYSSKEYNSVEVNIDSIDTHAICMMAGSRRSHRYAVYNAVKDLITTHIAMTIKI